MGFVLRNVLYVLCVGDSCALLMDGIGLPINIWKRCGVNEELGVCSWMDSLENYPNHKEGKATRILFAALIPLSLTEKYLTNFNFLD